jgi:hypothetical protein
VQNNKGNSMANLAHVMKKIFEPVEHRDELPAGMDLSARVPAFANEDIYFFVKRIDNTTVVREADPTARGTCWKLIGTVVAAVVLLIGVLLPSAYGLLAGYQIQSLRKEAVRLSTEQASLELAEAHLLSPERMEELAKAQHFIDPAPQAVVYLDDQKGALASAAVGKKSRARKE